MSGATATRTSAGTAETAKAVVQDPYGPADVLYVEQVEERVAGPDDVLVRVHAAGVDQRVWHSMTGLPYVFRPVAGVGAG